MTSQLDLLLINPGGRARAYQGLGAELTAVEPPVWAGLLAANAAKHGFTARILDAEADDLPPEDVGRAVADVAPLLAVVVVFGANPSASTQKMGVAGDICRQIRRAAPQTKILLAGLHVSALPERTLREEDVDYVCQGEGPSTICGLLAMLREQGTDCGHVPGLWYRRGGQILFTQPAPLIQDLDAELPAVPWDLLPMDKYRAHNWHCFDHLDRRSPYAVIYTSLGCPYGCHFCCINALFGKRGIRYRGIPSVIEEIDFLVQKYGVKNIKILDELFVLKRERVEQFCDLLIPRGYDLNFWAYARVDTVDPPLLQKLRRAGVRWLCYGFESASTKVRKDVSKGFSDEQMDLAIRWTREAGIYIIANYMVGLPEDTAETMQATLDEAQRYNFEFFNLYCAMAYPGSKLYDQAQANGWALPETWDGYSQLGYDTRPLPTNHLAAADVLAFRDRAFSTYYGNPAYAQMIEAKFGPAVLTHVKNMTSLRLKRRLLGD